MRIPVRPGDLVALSGGLARIAGMVTQRWRTAAFAELNAPLADVLGAQAKHFEALRIHTVGDLLRHLPRHYLSGTELTDLATLEEGEHVAVMARVANIVVYAGRGGQRPGGRGVPNSRLEVTLTDGHGRIRATFFGRDHTVKWWQKGLSQGVRGIFVGKVGSFNGLPQMTHPAFVMLDAAGAARPTAARSPRAGRPSSAGWRRPRRTGGAGCRARCRPARRAGGRR